MEFKTWLESRNVVAGGAFGGGSRNRQDIRFQSNDARGSYGRNIERQIFDALVSCGMDLRPASQSQDMFNKIDAFWKKDDKLVPIQIKYRDTGDDILFEVLKDYNQKLIGRDMVGTAIYYAVLLRKGQIVVVESAEIKQKVNSVLKEADLSSGSYFISGVSLKVRQDPSSGTKKLIAYVSPSVLKIVKSCEANISF